MITLLNANSLHIPLADKSVHMCVTSPPYWSLRDYGVDNQLGLEKLHDCLGWTTGSPCGECYICHVVAWAREIKRVLRDDGTFWLNIGDSYAANRGDGASSVGKKQATNTGSLLGSLSVPPGLKPKDMCLIPARVALALQADGWYVRSDIIWSKPNPMPESVTDRPTKSHEYLWLLSKSEKYFYDQEAVREANTPETQAYFDKYSPKERTMTERDAEQIKRGERNDYFGGGRDAILTALNPAGRNRRSVWTIATQSFSGAHYATFPEKLVEPCIRAGTSERGCCPTCGAGWVRVIDTTKYTPDIVPVGVRFVDESRGDKTRKLSGREYNNQVKRETLGWQQSCSCPPHDPIPCTVFDPFAGSGTTLLVARKLGRSAVGLDLSFDYLHEQARARLSLDALDEWEHGKRDGASLADLPMFAEETA